MSKRGYDPGDERFFAGAALPILSQAGAEILYLINRGYPLKSAIRFVGDHHLLSERQRLALMRCAATDEQLVYRAERQTLLGAQTCVRIDGFNIIITLETALCGSFVFLGLDGVIRDLAGLRGSYRIIPETRTALLLLARSLEEVPQVEFFLDAPVSNSGRLRALIREIWQERLLREPIVELVPNADAVLRGRDGIVSSDSVVLDQAGSWINLTLPLVRQIQASIVSPISNDFDRSAQLQKCQYAQGQLAKYVSP